MFWFKASEYKEVTMVELNGKEVRVNIYHQNRNSSRVSIGKRGVNIRLSNSMSKAEKLTQTRKFLSWAEKELETRELNGPIYKSGHVLHLFDARFKLIIKFVTAKNASLKSLDEELHMSIPDDLDQVLQQESIRQLLVRYLRRRYQHKIETMLDQLNNKFQMGEVNQVRLKNNSSNWGSCSSKGNINISLRLLFAPEEVVCYVLIHELVHLKHPNHSVSFWKEVLKCCPDYRKSEQWLKQNGHLCVL